MHRLATVTETSAAVTQGQRFPPKLQRREAHLCLVSSENVTPPRNYSTTFQSKSSVFIFLKIHRRSKLKVHDAL